MTGTGTNTYIFGSDPCLVIDPGVDDEAHLEAIQSAAARRGGIGTVLISHRHPDHTGGSERLGAPDIKPQAGESFGSLRVIATPGHAPDHVCFLAEGEGGLVCFSGDLVLGQGSSIVLPGEGSLAAYLDSLQRVRRLGPRLICPGHGPWVTDPEAKLTEYIEHRLERERHLVAALDRGERSRAALLDEVWSDAPGQLRAFAALVMQAHLEKLAEEGRLPADLTD